MEEVHLCSKVYRPSGHVHVIALCTWAGLDPVFRFHRHDSHEDPGDDHGEERLQIPLRSARQNPIHIIRASRYGQFQL